MATAVSEVLSGIAITPGDASARVVTARSSSLANIRAGACAVSSGVLVVLSAPPFDCDWLIWAAFVPLLCVTRRCRNLWSAFFRGVLAGLPLFIGVGYGLFAFDVGLFIFVSATLALLVGGIFAAHAALRRAPLPSGLRVLLLPALWVLAECVSTHCDLPWSLALTQTRNLRLIQGASVLGAFWISFLILLVNSAYFSTAQSLLAIARGAPLRAENVAGPAIAALAFALSVIHGSWCLSHRPKAETVLRVASVQPAISSEVYRYQGLNPAYRRTLRTRVAELSAQAAAYHPDLLLWPEGGNGQFNFRVAALRNEIAALACDSRATLLLSSDDLDEAGRLFNAVFAVSPQGTVLGQYAKVRLTPVGEKQFTPGARAAPLPTPHGPIGALVCFESTMPFLARRLTAQGAVALFVTTSDVSFRNSSVPLLHSRFAVYRAVENRRFVIQASNAGPSLIVNPYGEVTAQTPFFARTILEGAVEPRHDYTLYTQWGDWPLLLLVTAVVVVSGYRLATARSRGQRSAARRGAAALAGRQHSGPAWMKTGGLAVGAVAGGLMLAILSVGLTSRAVPEFGGSWDSALRSLLTPPRVHLPSAAGREFREGGSNASGPNALAYLLSYLGMQTEPADLVADLTVMPHDTSLAELATVARQRGLSAWEESATFDALQHIPKPVIAQTTESHYVVILSASDPEAVDLFDPASGYVRLSENEFRRVWRGNLLIVRFPDRLGTPSERLALTRKAAPHYGGSGVP